MRKQEIKDAVSGDSADTSSERIQVKDEERTTVKKSLARPGAAGTAAGGRAPPAASRLVLDFSEIGLDDVPRVGGKNASLGQLFNRLKTLGVGVLDGFATTSHAYRSVLRGAGIEEPIREHLSGFDVDDVAELSKRARAVRNLVLEAPLPAELKREVEDALDRLGRRLGREPELAVRSSATAEDLPEASFAGQQETFLNIRGKAALLQAVRSCMASLFTDRAIHYRARHGFDHLQVALSVGVQPMVRSDLASSGVIFTLDPETGFRNASVITGSYGLGELVVQGVVDPDEWMVFKPTLAEGKRPILARRLGSKEVRLVYADGSRATRTESTSAEERGRFCLEDDEVLELGRWASIVEDHYSELRGRRQPMDLEWAKDGASGQLFIIQARPETVHSARLLTTVLEVFHLEKKHGPPILKGQAVGEKVGSGRVRVIRNPGELPSVQAGEVLVAPMTDPDWEPVLKRVSALVTDHGGRTAHAAIVSRELGLPCIVGTTEATGKLQTGDLVTVSCAEGSEGHVYKGKVAFTVEKVDVSTVPQTRTEVLLNVGDPSQAFKLSTIPSGGVGLARIEFIITNHIGIHPMALARYPRLSDAAAAARIAEKIGAEDPREFFVRRLSEGVARIAAAFHPRPVIVRMSDFKTNEYAQLLGGREFEPVEENPMIGFRGASRYYDARYAEGFALECAAILRVRRDMGLRNVKVMIPFCRTLKEARLVIETLAAHGLEQGQDGLEVYAMCELPSNVALADEFLEIFDGFSIGSNDLTQLVLGIDRDSGTVAHLFDERDGAVRKTIEQAIRAAQRAGKPIGICGQAPSDHPEFAGWLVELGVTSISLNPDAVLKTKHVIASAEAGLEAARARERK